MRTLLTSFLFASLTLAAGCASTSGKCADCDKAQSVVASVAAANPEVTRLTLHCGMGDGMHTCASTDGARVGKPSDPEDVQAVTTDQVVVLDEAGALDVTVPISHKDGKPMAACGVTLKNGGMSRDQAVAKAKQIAMAVETGLGGACECCCK